MKSFKSLPKKTSFELINDFPFYDFTKINNPYITYLEQIKDTINCEEFDQIYSFFDSAKNYRDSFTNVGSGPIKKTFVFSVDVDDKAGAIAEIATVLAKENINIKNIGINHNREIQQGALAIEFYNEASMLLAKHILKENNYCIY